MKESCKDHIEIVKFLLSPVIDITDSEATED